MVNQFNGTSWGTWSKLAGTVSSDPSCTSDGGGKWEGFLNIGGLAGSVPDCTSLNSGGQVACFAEAYFRGIYGSRFDGSSWAVGDWSTYGALGGEVINNATCTTQAAGQLVCGVIAIDNAFYADVYNGTSWSTWTKIGGTGVGIPACAPLGTGQAVCVLMGVDNKLTSVVGP